MADITKVRAEADVVKARLNEEFKQKIARLTTVDIDEIIRMLVRTEINSEQVAALKCEVEMATNKNQIIARVLSTPGTLCEQLKGVIAKIIK